jgi:hypothetical protein
MGCHGRAAADNKIFPIINTWGFLKLCKKLPPLFWNNRHVTFSDEPKNYMGIRWKDGSGECYLPPCVVLIAKFGRGSIQQLELFLMAYDRSPSEFPWHLKHPELMTFCNTFVLSIVEYQLGDDHCLYQDAKLQAIEHDYEVMVCE